MPIRNARLIARRIPGAGLLEVEGVDHAPWFSSPDETPAALDYATSAMDIGSEGGCLPIGATPALAPVRRTAEHTPEANRGPRPMPRVTANATELYYEVRGAGPPVLLMMGLTGDGGHFDELADLLADEFTVISYDRRGNGRSPAPAGWQTTSPEEQADDAAALLHAVGAGPVVVFGTSAGGAFALCLLVRYPEMLRGAILHEPGLYVLLDDPDAVRAPLRALVQDAMEAAGPAAAVEGLWCYVAGDDGWTKLSPALRERMVASAGTTFGVELGTYERYLPDDDTLAAIAAPVRLLVSRDSLPFFADIAGRLGQRLGAKVATTAGGHAAYHDDPRRFAEAVRPFLREASEVNISNAVAAPRRTSGRTKPTGRR